MSAQAGERCSPRGVEVFALKPWVQKCPARWFATLKGVAQALRLTNAGATPSELRLREWDAFPRVAKAQPWAGIGQRFQRSYY